MTGFVHVEVSGRGPFGLGESLRFHAGLNVVVGENGSGKTTLIEQLKRDYTEMAAKLNPQSDRLLPEDLVFMSDDILPSHRDLDGLVSPARFVERKLDLRVLEADVNTAFQRLLPDGYGYAEYLNGASFVVTSNWNVELRSRQGLLRAPSMPAGPQQLLRLAWVQSLRRQLDPDGQCPFVIERPFGVLDRVLFRKVAAALPTVAQQVILLLSDAERTGIALSWPVDYRLEVIDRELPRSRVVLMTG